MQGFADCVKVFAVTARADAIIGNSIFFHTTIITKYEFLVNLLFEQNHGHNHSLGNKAQTNGDNVEQVTQDYCSKEQ